MSSTAPTRRERINAANMTLLKLGGVATAVNRILDTACRLTDDVRTRPAGYGIVECVYCCEKANGKKNIKHVHCYWDTLRQEVDELLEKVEAKP